MARKINIALLIIIFSVFVFIEYKTPKPVDWSLSYSSVDKIPYGTYILRDLINDLFSRRNIKENFLSLYQLFIDEMPENKTILIVNDSFTPDGVDLEYLLKYAASGNDIFVSANTYSTSFMDSLKFEAQYIFTSSGLINNDSLKVNFSNPQLKLAADYTIKKSIFRSYLFFVDSAKTTLLGTINDSLINYVKIKYGNGYFYINSTPEAFTNYSMLQSNNADYVSKCLSYLPNNKDIIWDEYHKSRKKLVTTPIRFLLSKTPLKAAYYTLITGIVLFVIFEIKRRQRIIPVIEPLKNTTLDFVSTIGRLYFNNGNHKDIALKKFNFFLEFLRSKYFIKIASADDFPLELIENKTGVNTRLIKNIFLGAKRIRNHSYISDDELVEYNSQIELFYKSCKY